MLAAMRGRPHRLRATSFKKRQLVPSPSDPSRAVPFSLACLLLWTLCSWLPSPSDPSRAVPYSRCSRLIQGGWGETGDDSAAAGEDGSVCRSVFSSSVSTTDEKDGLYRLLV